MTAEMQAEELLASLFPHCKIQCATRGFPYEESHIKLAALEVVNLIINEYENKIPSTILQIHSIRHWKKVKQIILNLN